jgi:hypothetical protein
MPYPLISNSVMRETLGKNLAIWRDCRSIGRSAKAGLGWSRSIKSYRFSTAKQTRQAGLTYAGLPLVDSN